MIKATFQIIPALLITGVALAQGPSVAIVASPSGTISDCRFVDVQEKLTATGLFDSVDVISAFSGTPSLLELQEFDAILTYSNLKYQDPDEFGDVLADYVDSGGGVVAAVFAMTSLNVDLQIGGRWKTGGYEVISTGLGHSTTTASLGQVLVPSHPSMQGVSSLTATAAFRPFPTTGLEQGNVVAQWDDGAILVAQGAMANRIDLGLYPPSNDCFSTFWNATGDGALLMANSLVAVSDGSGTSIGTRYCTPAELNTTGMPSRLFAMGSSVAMNNNLTLRAVDMPQNQLGIFIVSVTQGFISSPGNSQGNLCIIGDIGRYDAPGEFQNTGTSGEFELALDLGQTPTGAGDVTILAGQTWNFQAWYRDFIPGQGATSNFTDAIEILFQ